MPEGLAQLDRIMNRLADRDDLRIGPRLTEAEIQTLEHRLRVALPEEYRLFLKEIGNGGSGADLREVYSLDASLLEDFEELKYDQPFPLTKRWIWEGADEEEEEDEPDAGLKSACWTNGQLPLCGIGDGEFWVLITAGPERGNMWLVTEFGVAPSTPRCGFLEWFEAWMDKRMDDLYDDL